MKKILVLEGKAILSRGSMFAGHKLSIDNRDVGNALAGVMSEQLPNGVALGNEGIWKPSRKVRLTLEWVDEEEE